MAPVEQPTLPPHATVPDPLANAKFSLNSLGVAGFFGGDIAVNGMATVIFFFGRRFGGLYNTPGSLEIARRYGQLANSRIYRGLFPGDMSDPSQLFGLDGKPGPKFLAARSGSLFEKTSHIGYLIARMARREPCDHSVHDLANTRAQRLTSPGTVTVIDLNHLAENEPQKLVHPTLPYRHYGLLALFPIVTSIGACVGSALVADWWSFGCILLGMIANGCACYVLGSGKLAFQHPEPAPGAPPGDGILWAGGNDVVVIRGSERAVNTLTRGRFFLHYGDYNLNHRPSVAPAATNQPGAYVEIGKQQNVKRETDNGAPEGGKPNSFWIGIASLLLTTQFLAQLLLIPQATLFGQLMFVCTLAVSGGYNAYLTSINREDIQTRILRKILKLDEEPGAGKGQGGQRRKVQKFEFGTWTATSIFACLALQPDPNKRWVDSPKVLNALIPNDTEVWKTWKGILKGKLHSRDPWVFTAEDRELRRPKSDGRGEMRMEGQETEEERRQRQEDKVLLSLFIADAEAAYQRYCEAFPNSNP